jgi:hypothetical protein
MEGEVGSSVDSVRVGFDQDCVNYGDGDEDSRTALIRCGRLSRPLKRCASHRHLNVIPGLLPPTAGRNFNSALNWGAFLLLAIEMRLP